MGLGPQGIWPMNWLAISCLVTRPSYPSGELLDAYREMINIVVGGLLTKVDTESQVEHEPAPGQRSWKPAPVKEIISQAQKCLFYDVEGNPLVVGWKSF